MTWQKIARMYGVGQTLRRRSNQDSLNTLSNKDVTFLLYPPPRKGKDIATPSNVKKALAKAQADTQDGQKVKMFTKNKSRMIWPEERLMWQVYRRNPEIKKIPYNINSFEPPFAKAFALRQYELMQQGMTEEEAYRDTEKEMQPHKLALLKSATSLQPTYSVIQSIQEEEEKELADAHEHYRKLQGN